MHLPIRGTLCRFTSGRVANTCVLLGGRTHHSLWLYLEIPQVEPPGFVGGALVRAGAGAADEHVGAGPSGDGLSPDSEPPAASQRWAAVWRSRAGGAESSGLRRNELGVSGTC
jgi:hypothetical protein